MFVKLWRRRKLKRRAMPGAWRAIIERNVAAARKLTGAEREELEQHVKVILAEKNFEGAGGLELTDEVRVTIAANAALLLIGRNHGARLRTYFPGVRTVIVYPGAYRVPQSAPGAGGVVTPGVQTRLGEAWSGPGAGTIVLSWRDVLAGSRGESANGHNVTIHEFAHALDAESGFLDGTPALDTRADFRPWARVMSREFGVLRRAAMVGVPTVLSTYGATNVAEFFAVATEAYFGQPIELKCAHPELYEQLERYYRWSLVSPGHACLGTSLCCAESDDGGAVVAGEHEPERFEERIVRV